MQCLGARKVQVATAERFDEGFNDMSFKKILRDNNLLGKSRYLNAASLRQIAQCSKT